ncbi:hypothetical protein SAMN05216588_10762 [Pseudomonas flavescens]|uniref:Uncharacterized protein n=1 Tax=Phytopseudomonas flavescens TaxID=29435 RepID=A0A1G8EZR2_9GAMM|nr:hypothetical protein SAMN05216588_10762 [Pseudomonas flavescens]
MLTPGGVRINLIFNGVRVPRAHNALLDAPIKLPGMTSGIHCRRPAGAPAVAAGAGDRHHRGATSHRPQAHRAVHPRSGRNVLEFNPLVDGDTQSNCTIWMLPATATRFACSPRWPISSWTSRRWISSMARTSRRRWLTSPPWGRCRSCRMASRCCATPRRFSSTSPVPTVAWPGGRLIHRARRLPAVAVVRRQRGAAQPQQRATGADVRLRPGSCRRPGEIAQGVGVARQPPGTPRLAGDRATSDCRLRGLPLRGAGAGGRCGSWPLPPCRAVARAA